MFRRSRSRIYWRLPLYVGILIEGGEESGPWKDGIMLSREERKAGIAACIL